MFFTCLLGITVNIDSSSKQNNTTRIFNIHPVAVKKWVEELPLGSTGESSKQLYHALKKVNQQNNSLRHHLDFLEIITPTVTLLYPRLSRHFTDISLPLSTKTRNVIHVTISLLTEILRSYQIILKILATKKPFGWKKLFSLALHRSFIYTSQILCVQRLAYQPHTKGIWKNVFGCYQHAKKLKLLNKKYRDFTKNQKKTSIEYEFKRLLLLSLLSADNLEQKNMREVHKLMPLWIKNSDILTKEPDDKKTCFTLNLLSDIPPYLIGTRKDNTQQSINRHYLSTNKLQKILSNYLNKMEDNNAIRIQKNILSRSTVQSLLSSWSRNRLRTEIRKEGAGFMDIITGLTAIHFVLEQQNQPVCDEASTVLHDNIIDFESTLTIEPINDSIKDDTLNLDYFLSSSNEEDIWGRIYDNSLDGNLTPAHWTETGAHKIFNFAKSIVLDYSEEGYHLSVNAIKVNSLKNNELVAVRKDATAAWTLAQIKWLHFSGKGDVQFGLGILSHHVLPVHVRYQANDTLSKPLPCLLGLDRKKIMLFIPALPTDLKDKKLQLEHQAQHSEIYLKDKILTTPAFDVYEILETQTEDNLLSQKVNKLDVIIETDTIWENF